MKKMNPVLLLLALVGQQVDIWTRAEPPDQAKEEHTWGHGFLIKQKQQLTITNSEWTLSTDIRISHYREIVKKVHGYLEESGTLLKRSVNSPRNASLTRNLTLFEKEVAARIDYENSILMAKSKQMTRRLNVVDALISDKQRSWSKRTKRLILAPMMGTVLKFLFGTADNNDVIRINRKIEELGTAINSIHHINEVQTTLFQTLHNDNVAQNAAISKLESASNSINNELKRLKNDVDNKSQQAEYERRLMFSIFANIEVIRDTVDRADRIIQDLLIDISEIAMGKIPPHLLPPDLLVEGLQAVSNILPQEMSLLSPSSTGVVWHYYHLILVKSVVLNDGLRLFIDLPIIVPRSTFNLYNIIPFPTRIPGTNNYVILNNITPFVAVSKNLDYYTTLSSHDLGSCLHVPTPICTRQFPIWTLSKPSCELSIIMQDSHSITEQSEISVIQSQLPRFLYLSNDDWAIFFHLQ